jgi:AraC-like DNA-binding protein
MTKVILETKVKIITCPQCGGEILVAVDSGGRKRLNIPVKLVCDTLKATLSVKDTAQELNCSRGYIYKMLKERGLTPRDVIKGG